MTDKEYTADEVAKHTSNDDCWLIIGNSSNGTYVVVCRSVVVVFQCYAPHVIAVSACWGRKVVDDEEIAVALSFLL